MLSQIAQKVDEVSQVEHFLAVGLGKRPLALDVGECLAEAFDDRSLNIGQANGMRVEAASCQGAQAIVRGLRLHHLQCAIGLGGVEQLVGENHGRHLWVIHHVVDDLERHRLLRWQACLIEQHSRSFSAAVGIIVALEHHLAFDGRVIHCLDLGVGGLLRALVPEGVKVVQLLIQRLLRGGALHVLDCDRERQSLGAAWRATDHDWNLGVDANHGGKEVLGEGCRWKDADWYVSLVVESTKCPREHCLKVTEQLCSRVLEHG